MAELESLGLRPEEVIDFSASINPLGPSARVLEAAQSVYLGAYPDPDCLKLREAIGGALDVEPGQHSARQRLDGVDSPAGPGVPRPRAIPP